MGTTVTMLDPGQDRFGNYRAINRVAADDLGVSYRGHHIWLDLPVTIVTPHPYLWQDAAAEARVLHLAEVARRLPPSGVPALREIARQPCGRAYAVFERPRGFSLARHLARGASMSLAQRLDIAAQAAAVLAQSHGRGVVHRALRPSHLHLVPNADAPSGCSVVVVGWSVAALHDAGIAAAGQIDVLLLGVALHRLLRAAPVPAPVRRLIDSMVTVAPGVHSPLSMEDVAYALRVCSELQW